MSVLNGNEVASCCRSFVKVNPNGIDLAPKKVSRIPRDSVIFLHGERRGYLEDESNKKNVVDRKSVVTPDPEGYYNLEKGELYELRFPEVRIPLDCTGFAFPRSTINRLGIIKLETAIFDSGYSGEPTQTIFTPLRAIVHKDEALIQLVLIRNEKATQKPYQGFYQDEKG
jgi:deoxycytidine triphosphate deaminase